jgi:hypothetical protein
MNTYNYCLIYKVRYLIDLLVRLKILYPMVQVTAFRSILYFFRFFNCFHFYLRFPDFETKYLSFNSFTVPKLYQNFNSNTILTSLECLNIVQLVVILIEAERRGFLSLWEKMFLLVNKSGCRQPLLPIEMYCSLLK